MKAFYKTILQIPVAWVFIIATAGSASAQTDIDAVMMEKYALCIGPM